LPTFEAEQPPVTSLIIKTNGEEFEEIDCDEALEEDMS
jgi:hypothetical protein